MAFSSNDRIRKLERNVTLLANRSYAAASLFTFFAFRTMVNQPRSASSTVITETVISSSRQFTTRAETSAWLFSRSDNVSESSKNKLMHALGLQSRLRY